jgi:hypothetical protein
MPFSTPRFIKAAALALAAALGWPTGDAMAHAANAGRTETVHYPWEGTDDEIVVNLAIGSLRDSLMQWLTTDRGVHAETLLVSIGAIAGFAAQTAALERMNRRDVPLPAGFDKTMPREDFQTYLREAGLILIAQTKDTKEQFYFGDLINGYLAQQKTTIGHSLFAILSAAAIEAGVPPGELPDVTALFTHVASTVGKPQYGILRPPKPLNPHYTPRAALNEFWPGVKFIFERTDGQGIEVLKGNNVKPEYWPLITALVARQFLLLAKDTIAPRVALALMMESAIVTSKVDPKTVPQTEAGK